MKSLLAFVVILAVVCSQLEDTNVICDVCHDIVHEFQKSIPAKPTELILDYVAYKYCVKKNIEKPNVCKGAVHEMMDSIVNSAWRHYTDPHSLCHKLRLCPK